MEDHTAFGQGSLHINDSLIGTALPVKGGVFLFFYKRTVHQYVCQGHKRKVFYFLPKIAGIDPDVLDVYKRQELNMDVCPVCGSKNLTKIDRMNGYLSYSRVKGDTRLNDAKMAEIAERKSM